jgi:hypothetical protein
MRPRGLDGPPIDADELRRLYVEDLLPVGRVAKRFRTSAGRVVRELERLGIEKRPHQFYLIKHPQLANLKIGQWIDVPPASPHSPPYPTFYDMAKREGIKISVRRVADGLYRLTRVA